ncbi:helix-turn-helix domain-containing protein [Peribacillus frigoritolerans]|uniref:helix-turn-helix domain-containing protein n=1 Tax=Peribacillus frigoritolerans TaxID=450367 RepID=UPI001059DF44|nr:helix-turn-helix transcriptional regulator [Peribacillus frigoritolerans]TDL74247.1 XRE family transcriptional regulator [Peribacillus frigoritolerans]
MLIELKEGERLPYKPEITADMLPYLRAVRSLNQSQFADKLGVPQSTLSQLESGDKRLSEHYEKVIRKGIAKLRISSEEIEYIKRMIEIKKQRGYK